MSYSAIDPSDSIDATEDEAESLEELGMSVRDADTLDDDVVVVAAADLDADADEDALDEDDDDEDADDADDEAADA